MGSPLDQAAWPVAEKSQDVSAPGSSQAQAAHSLSLPQCVAPLLRPSQVPVAEKEPPERVVK